MGTKLTVLEEGRFDKVDLLSPFEMNNILGGDGPTCTNGYCQQSYSENTNLGTIECGCGYIKPVDREIDPGTEPTPNPTGIGG